MTPSEMQADQDAFSRQYDEDQATKAAKEAQQQQPPSFLQQWMAPLGRVTHSMLDGAVAAADAAFDVPVMEKARDVAAGAMTGAVNIADSVHSLAMASPAGPPPQPAWHIINKLADPIWQHAKAAILDFRDAVAVQDPTLADNLVQGAAQLAIPFAGYSRGLAALHGVARVAAAGAITDATALQPHDPRSADLYALGKTVDGKLGNWLNTLAPDGSALNAYIEYLADRKNESEAEGRFKNVLDGFGVNMLATPLIHAVASGLKYGTAGLRFAMENGVGSAGDLVPSMEAQRGSIGVTNNASGESTASKEAQNWVKAQKASGVTRYRLDPDGTPQPLMGIEGRDPQPMTGQPVVDIHKDGTHELIERGGMTKLQAEGLVQRAKTLHGLGPKEEKPGA